MHETLLRQAHVCKKLGISTTTLWRWRREGIFPEPIRIPGTSVQGWSERTVNDWLNKHFKGA